MLVIPCVQILMVFVFHYVTSVHKYATKYITLPVDHFSFANNDTFELKYLVNNTYWDVEKGPIFFYTGNEGPIVNLIHTAGFMREISKEFNAMVVFAEHRYYGDSMPYGNDSFNDHKKLGYLTSQQAIADFVDLIMHLRDDLAPTARKRPNPVIAFGGSYGGMLAAWLRMKYPASVEGAIASSAPIWQFTGMTPCNDFYKVASRAYRSKSAECAATISNSWKAINNITNTGSGKMWLKENWILCKPLKNIADVTQLKAWATGVYEYLAMNDLPYPSSTIEKLCQRITYHGVDDEKLLMSVFRGLSVHFNSTGGSECLDFENVDPESTTRGWRYQTCTEMVFPDCSNGGEDDIFERIPWNFEEYAQKCEKKYGVRPIVDAIEKQYGGKNLQAASNIIFSNGLWDPFSSGGVLKNISSTVQALLMPDTTHQVDLLASHPNDTLTVVQTRQTHKRWIKKWIHDYWWFDLEP